MRKIAMLLVVFLVAVSVIFFGFPGGEASAAWKPSPAEKLGRGTSNVFFSLFEIPYNLGKQFERTDPVGAVPAGILKGTLWTVLRAVAGVVDIATFPIPTRQIIGDFDAGWWSA